MRANPFWAALAGFNLGTGLERGWLWLAAVGAVGVLFEMYAWLRDR